jgi:hypothetical protein
LLSEKIITLPMTTKTPGSMVDVRKVSRLVVYRSFLIPLGDIMLDLSNEPDLGYVFYPYKTIDHPGHPRLDVIISRKPTYRHFDPERVNFPVVSQTEDFVKHVVIRHPWTLKKRYRVCAGRIVLTDLQGKRIEAFSFGGDLQIVSDAEHTICVLQSRAPIFSLHALHDLPTWITVESEIILARQRAHWDPKHPHEFQTHLATLDPLLLYASCLQTIQDKHCDLYLEEEELDHQGLHFVQTEIHRLQENEEWPLLVPTPDQLFRLTPKQANISTVVDTNSTQN